MRLAVGIAVGLVAGCTIYGESSDASNGEAHPSASADAGNDGNNGDVDGGSSSSGGTGQDGGKGDKEGGSDGGDSIGLGLPPNGDFEIPVCSGWSPGGTATLADETTLFHGGSHACKVCGSGTIWQISTTASYTASAGDVLRSTAWVRAESGSVPIEIGITSGTSDQHTDIITIGTTYTFAQSPSILLNAAGMVDVELTVTSGGGACFIVDDAAVVRVPP